MPLEKIVVEKEYGWALWRLDEREEELDQHVLPSEKIPESITHSQKRLEWFGGRALTRLLIQRMGEDYRGITKDAYGKPSLVGSNLHVSMSHSYPYVAVILQKHTPAGIDLEQPKEKLLRIAPRVLATQELTDAGNDLQKHCVYWCAKEALIKIYGKKDLVLSENLRIDAFALQEEGHILGRLIVNSHERIIPLYYQVTPKFVMVFNIG